MVRLSSNCLGQRAQSFVFFSTTFTSLPILLPDVELEDKKPLIVSGMKIMLNEPNLRVRSVFGQVVITMAHHHYLGLEGGSSHVEFVVRQCAINPEDKVNMNIVLP